MILLRRSNTKIISRPSKIKLMTFSVDVGIGQYRYSLILYLLFLDSMQSCYRYYGCFGLCMSCHPGELINVCPFLESIIFKEWTHNHLFFKFILRANTQGVATNMHNMQLQTFSTC